MNIAERIKELRRKNNLTQEKMAEYLNVSCQAVSKWECGVSAPDLSLIGPLARLFGTTADDLLGVHSREEEARWVEWDEACRNSAVNPDHEANYHLAAEAVREYPGEFRYLVWLADAEFSLARDESEENTGCGEFFQEMMDNALRHYQLVIEDCPELPLRCQAILGMIRGLNFIGRTDEAIWYAEQVYPPTPSPTREEAIALCLEGEELLDLRKKMVQKAKACLQEAENRLAALMM